MAKGENIFKRKDGRWEARYIKGHESTGKVRYGFCYGKTYREAKEKVEKCRLALASGAAPSQSTHRRRFASYCDEWLQANRGRLKESTAVRYETILEQHIKPELGGYSADELTEELIVAFADELLIQNGYAPKTVKDILVILHSILKYTARQNQGLCVPVEIVYPKVSKKEARVLSRSEQERLISCLLDELDPCKFGILLAMFTGMRIGELCALRWEHISLPDRTIRICATMQRLKNPEPKGGRTRIVITDPKSGTSVRMIPMTEEMAGLCKKMDPGRPAAFLLTGDESQYMEPRTLQYRLRKYTDACGLADVHFHTLRHTFATRCVEVGFEVKSLSEILGHATTTITLDRYVHSSMELKRDNMSKLSAIGF